MNKMDGLRGMLLPLPTVFDGEGQVDEAVMRDMIQFYVHTGVHGLFPLGSYGMGPALSIEQRKRVAKIVVEEVRGRIPIVLHVGAVDPYTTIELGLHGRSLNVDAIGMVGPYYYSDRTMPELLLHFKMVDKAVQLPIFIYNNPEYQGYPITLPMMQELAATVPNIFGTKLAGDTVKEALKYVEAIPGFAVFVTGGGLMPEMLEGVRGTVSPSLTLTPELAVALVKAIDERRDEYAIQLQTLVTEVSVTVRRLWKKYGRAIQGEGLRALGLPIKQFPRWPTPPVPEAEREELFAVLKRARALAVERPAEAVSLGAA